MPDLSQGILGPGGINALLSYLDQQKSLLAKNVGGLLGEARAPAVDWAKDRGQEISGLLSDPKAGLQNIAQERANYYGSKYSPEDLAMMFAPMGIVKPTLAKTLNTAPALPIAPEFRAAVANTPGASLDESGLLMRVMRNQQPEQGLQPSVRGGVFYLPEGAAQAKHYSTGKIGYGGPERVSGETLVQNPLFAKGGTGGKAPEAAYDSLLGKGAYQAMRSDALKATNSYGRQYTIPYVDEFLNKYAPELIDQTENIVRNSRKGNTLPYALQEAAVASAVRNAGHDAVLGYSKSKGGAPFLSELFDVREMNYPDKFGTPPDIWNAFTK